jgi:LysR family transcriptional regulator, mexEF-oprN operon transcriptional activator
MSNVDLNLLVVFDAVMAERNFRRAAERLNRSQPAISQSVARLRDIWADQLFQRTSAGVDPTPRAEAIWSEIREPLALMRSKLAPSTFLPATTHGTIRIGLSDDIQILALAELVSGIRADAPNLVLHSVEVDHQSVWTMVKNGLVDLGITVSEPAPKGLAGKLLLNQGFVVVRRADTKPPSTLTDYLKRDHVVVAFSSNEAGFTDRRLATLGKRRRIIAYTPRFSSIPDLVTRTGALATIPEAIARHFAQSGELALSPCPFAMPDVTVSLCWHQRRHADPLNAWLRTKAEAIIRLRFEIGST